ncbi:MAG: hypothetical protein O3A10_00990 [Chloroflexi bacterium]|nr:hypothetical protein [Chloroflexota bacterium]MDA1146358.1 hypothetical protein [Chloroflexota bacterium]
MEVVVISVLLVTAFCLLTVLPTSICLRAAEERGVDPLIGLFVGVLLSWVGVIVFAPAAGRRRASSGAGEAPRPSPPSEAFVAPDRGSSPVISGTRGR